MEQVPPESPRREGRRPYSRTDHRSRSHESAHNELQADLGAIPDHPLIPPKSAQLVTTEADLGALIGRLRQVGTFAYDSEFIGEATYHPRLCLIQVASAHEVALIDPLVGLDLTPFWELLCEPGVEKIVHAGQQDIEPVVRHLGRAPVNVFDTQISAGLAGLPYPLSLSRLVGEMTGVRLGKGLTFTHWDQRPLSAVQLRYAADDVRYLPHIRVELERRLDALGHTAWAAEECATQCDPALYAFDPATDYLRVRGAGSLQPRNMAVLRALAAWRDIAARDADLPPRAFLRDEILIDLARTPVKSIDRLDRVKGLPRPVEAEHGDALVDATLAALALPASDLPTRSEFDPTPPEKFATDALWAAAQVFCAGQGIDTALVCSRQDLSDFAQQLLAGQPLAESKLTTGWRSAALGRPLIDLVEGTTDYAMQWKAGTLQVAPTH